MLMSATKSEKEKKKKKRKSGSSGSHRVGKMRKNASTMEVSAGASWLILERGGEEEKRVFGSKDIERVVSQRVWPKERKEKGNMVRKVKKKF